MSSPSRASLRRMKAPASYGSVNAERDSDMEEFASPSKRGGKRGRSGSASGRPSATTRNHTHQQHPAHNTHKSTATRPIAVPSAPVSESARSQYGWDVGTPRTQMGMMNQRRSELLDNIGEGLGQADTADALGLLYPEWIELVKKRDVAVRTMFEKEREREKYDALPRLLAHLEVCSGLTFASTQQEAGIRTLVAQLRNKLRQYCTERNISVLESDIAAAMATDMSRAHACANDSAAANAIGANGGPQATSAAPPPPPPPPPPAPPMMMAGTASRQPPVARKLDISSAVEDKENAGGVSANSDASRDDGSQGGVVFKAPLRPQQFSGQGGMATATGALKGSSTRSSAAGAAPNAAAGASFFVENISAAAKSSLRKTQCDRSPGGTPARKPRGHNAHLRHAQAPDEVSPAAKDEGSFLASALRKKFRSVALPHSPAGNADTPTNAPATIGGLAVVAGSPSAFDSPYQPKMVM